MSVLSVSNQHDSDVLMVRPGKWTLTVVTLLREQTMRFNEIKRVGGISQKTLTMTLRELERDGFVTRTMFATIPPRVDYQLTELGRELLDLADGLRRFAERNREQVLAARERFDASGGEPAIRLVHAE
ncbi:MAG: helix-turn-helix transcriptional regulator [Alphaproteobacteria bacterium]|nr:helix-turn-helix transcriptional regulator [Alphaproteobacteria bacterium]MBU1562269.1 helix-turn-helix transcriptional regulator [Alphaproteobacteria bacterium]MBU2302759.1 helix-turn-helix transcriptional regulator [Alphaproteobacteria bacterium]MBU2366687.1 helix-turn-helix transcriptional regulator [Alphaproteobacteria bacterium]